MRRALHSLSGTLRLSAVAMALLGVAACESAVGPAEPEGLYVLESVGGAPLPVVVFEDESYRYELLADTLRLYMDGSGSKVVVQRVTRPGQVPSEGVSGWESRIGYRVRGGRFEMSTVCGPLDFCAPPPHWTGAITSRGIELAIPDGVYDAGPFLYRRVRR